MNETTYLRELAKKYLEYANLPVMKEREQLWYRHNDGDKSCNPVIIEMLSFEQDLLPPLFCTDPFHRQIEYTLQSEIIRHEWIGDDRVIPAYLPVSLSINRQHLGVTLERETAGGIGFHIKPILEDLERDFEKLGPSTYSFDGEAHEKKLLRAAEIVDGILPVVTENHSLDWAVMLSKDVVDLMSMEGFFYAMMDTPELTHKLFSFLREDYRRYLLWQEQEGLLCRNTKNQYVGSGSYGFTHTMPESGERVLLNEIWGNMNSQESVGISPAMFGEFVFPYYAPLAELFGKVYWGCCEPVHSFWEDCISKLPNLAKVSISAWCDEAFMAERLKDSPVIYSRKPSPNFIGAAEQFDESAFRAHIQKTADTARDCNFEIIFRDIYTLCGDKGRAKRAVSIVREILGRKQ